VIISGLSGNEIFCLAQKGYYAGEIAIGNSVRSLGLSGALGSFGQSMSGGELDAVTALISEGRHAAIGNMEREAQTRGGAGVTGVVSELRTLAGYTEFLAQGTSVHSQGPIPRFFSTAASGMQLYCHLDAGYVPLKFVMGNIAYALGLGRGITGMLRTFAMGEVHEYSRMYNEIRHHALQRLRSEAAAVGANAVVDVSVRVIPYGAGSVELLLTGTASHHPRLASSPTSPDAVVTSELTGEELWNLAKLGLVPLSLVMATSVYSLGLRAGIGAWAQSFSRGELPQVSSIIYQARENCLNLLRDEATRYGAERVVGNRLTIMEIAPGLVEVVALGTAVRRAEGMLPESPNLLPQAIIVDRDALETKSSLPTMPATSANATPAIVWLVVFMSIAVPIIGMIVFGIVSSFR
jgi:uncharacterized protein YbjQ (UPF0145 family)